MEYIFGILVILALITGVIVLLVRALTKASTSVGWSKFGLGLALYIFTIIFVEQVINLLFPELIGDKETMRVAGKLVVDTSLIIAGMIISFNIAGKALLYAGVTRYFIIFFEMRGMDATTRVIVIFVILVALIIFGIKTFGKNLMTEGAKNG